MKMQKSLISMEKGRASIYRLGGEHEVKLFIHKGKDDSELINEFQHLKNQIVKNRNTIEGREQYIRNKEDQIRLLEKERRIYQHNKIPFIQMSKEAKINYKALERFSYANMILTNFSTTDTILMYSASWIDTIPLTEIVEQQADMILWLKERWPVDSIVLNNNM